MSRELYLGFFGIRMYMFSVLLGCFNYIYNLKSVVLGVREGNYSFDCDLNIRKVRKIKIKRKREGRIEGKVGIWE